MTGNDLELYVDLWNSFYKSEMLENVTISDAHNVHCGSYTEPFYNISGTIDVAINVASTEWSKLITETERYFTDAPPSRAMEREAVNEELNARGIKSITFNATISTRISRDSYHYVMTGGSQEIKGFIDACQVVNYTTVDGEEHSGDELHGGSVFYREVLLHFVDSLHNSIDSIGNSLRIVVKRRRNR